jgi:IclR family pca regulon transcriptional regulator
MAVGAKWCKSLRPETVPGSDPFVARHKHHSSLYHGFQLLQVLLRYGRSLGVSEIARELKLAVSTTHDLLATLGALNFIDQNRETKRYSVSPEIFAFFRLFSNEFGHNSQVNRILRDYCAKHDVTLYVSMLCRTRCYVVCASGPMGDTVVIGANSQVYASSCGKAIVAQLPECEWPSFAPEAGEPKLTPYTKQSVEGFYKELSCARADGVGWNIQETAFGLCSVAAPVFAKGKATDRAVAIVLPHGEWIVRDRERLAIEVKGLAAVISSTLLM